VTVQTGPQELSFQAEAAQILDLVTRSLSSSREIFLRELISNASDAVDRLRLELLAQSRAPEQDGPVHIRVGFDAGAGTITVSDDGIGMSRQEVIDHIGAIAGSGTRGFLRALSGSQRQDTALTGQFGAGFYSAFIVADKVTLITRRAGQPADQGVRWESGGQGTYTLENIDCPSRGTTVVLHLRAGQDDLLSGHRLRAIIQKFSDHISVPIRMPADPAGETSRTQDHDRRPAPADPRQPGIRTVDQARERPHRPGPRRILPADHQ
jgi:molecular chaperone HtpG